MKKFIEFIIIIVFIFGTPNLTPGKEAPIFTPRIFEPERPKITFCSTWYKKKQKIRFSPSFVFGVRYLEKPRTDTYPQILFKEFLDLHKAALAVQKKYKSFEGITSSKDKANRDRARESVGSSQVCFTVVRLWIGRIRVFEYETRRELFTYTESDEDIYPFLKYIWRIKVKGTRR